MKDYFKSLETLSDASAIDLAQTLASLSFNEQGLLPVITQDASTQQVLMLAWMNHAAIEKTLSSGLMTYWSRSRSKFWLKGETSGHYQKLKSMRIDCDGDAIVCQVEQQGAACHTGRTSCFYLDIDVNAKTLHILGDAQPV